jgi:hypothetical protein
LKDRSAHLEAKPVSSSTYSSCMARCELLFQDTCRESGMTAGHCASQYLNCVRDCDRYKVRRRPPVQSTPPILAAVPGQSSAARITECQTVARAGEQTAR